MADPNIRRVETRLAHPKPRQMADSNMHDRGVDALELIVDEGRPANAGRFFQLGSDLVALLDELSDLPVAWRVQDLRVGSAIARVTPPAEAPAEGRILRLAVDSLGAAQEGGNVGDDWNPDAIKAAHRFVEHGQPVENEKDWTPPRLRLVSDRDEPNPSVSLTSELGARLAVLQPFERRMPGSVRGTLVGLNVSRGNRASLKMPTGRVVRVAFESSRREALKAALYQDVELIGELRQDGDGRVFHVRAEDLIVLGKPDLHWSDLFGMDPGYTEGLSTDDWLEAHRGKA